MEGTIISKSAQKVQSKFEEIMSKIINEAEDVTTLLENKPTSYLVYDPSLGKNANVPAIGIPKLCSILQRRLIN